MEGRFMRIWSEHPPRVPQNGGVTRFVDAWSADVLYGKYSEDFEIMLKRCRQQIERLGYKFFTYSLITME